MDLETIKKKLLYGDFNVIAKMLEAPSAPAARGRFLRGDLRTIEAARVLIENREKLIKDFKATKQE